MRMNTSRPDVLLSVRSWLRNTLFRLLPTLVLFAPVSAAGSGLIVRIDFNRFRYDSSSVYLELYYSVARSGLTYVKAGSRYRADIIMHASISRVDSPVVSSMWRVPCYVNDTAGTEDSKVFVGVSGFVVKPGDYSLRMISRDLNDSTKADTAVKPLHVVAFPRDRCSISDIELCSSIRQIPPDKDNVFYKNTLEVVPNPSAVYGLGLPIFYYYAEVYNLLKNTGSNEYLVKYVMLDAADRVVRSQEKAPKKRVNESSVEVGTVNVSNLSGGTYSLVFSIIDPVTRDSISVRKKFFVYNPTIAAEATSPAGTGDVMSSEYAIMPESEVDRVFAEARYISSNGEMSQYETLKTLEAKRKFLFDFWKRRDQTPLTPVNEVKQEYLGRVEYAKQNFRTGMREGWKTDRGRVLIVYGQPDEIERHPSETDTRPYEIWYYHGLEGGVLFVFVDRSGFSDYILVHSTHRNELRDDDWESRIKTN